MKQIGRAPEIWRCFQQSNDWFRVSKAYLGISAPQFPFDFQTPWNDVVSLKDQFDLVTAWIIFYRREYQVPAGCQTIIDAGANIGTFSLYASHLALQAKIFALEPYPKTFDRLNDTLQRNHMEQRVVPCRVALAKDAGPRKMEEGNGISQSRGVIEDNGTGGGIHIDAITLEDFLAQRQIDRVDLMKMDIEGSEHDVLHNTPDEVLRRIDRIAMEYHPNASKEKLFNRLRKAGFNLTHDAPIDLRIDSGVAHFELAK